MKYKFNKSRNKAGGVLRLNGQKILKSKSFPYLGSIIHKYLEIEEHGNHKIRAGQIKWRCALGLSCDCRIPIKLNWNFL